MTEAQYERLVSQIGGIDSKYDRLVGLMDGMNKRIDDIDRKAVTKSDVLQAVLQVQGFTLAVIVGGIVVANTFGMIGTP